MIVVCVHVHVQPEHRESFIEATLENAARTIYEPGNLRFDVLQQADDPDRFVLYEVYRDQAAFDAHCQAPHFIQWRDLTKDWTVEPRTPMVTFQPAYPAPSAWSK